MSLHRLGDYEQRERGLLQLMRPKNVFLYDRWRHEAQQGVVAVVPEELRVGYAVLRAYAAYRGDSLGEPDADLPIPGFHPLLFLWSCIHIQKSKLTRFAPLITTAYEELVAGRGK